MTYVRFISKYDPITLVYSKNSYLLIFIMNFLL